MKTRFSLTGTFLLVAALACLMLSDTPGGNVPETEAGGAIGEWYASRAFPFESIDMSAVTRTHEALRQRRADARQAAFPGSWQSIGPMNFGGRLLCLAFNPQNPNTLYAGSASGGLWRSYSGGVGANAWEPVATGFPVIGIAAIAFHPADSNVLYLGTGEVYNYQNTGNGTSVRTTRGTYGIGILKTSDGGATWNASLNWQYDELRGVQDIVVNPQNPLTVIAATTEGTYRSLDGGNAWSLIHNVIMAVDIAMNPADTAMFFVSAGNNSSPAGGIYKTTDGGNTFTKLTNGLPASFTGKTLVAISPSQSNILFASVADQLAQIGFYKSVDYGASWTLINTEDVAQHQGWYSHDVAVRPDNPNQVICAGIDAWKSNNGGISLTRKSFWYNWDFSATPIGGPEGPPDYVHGDIHHVYYHPVNFDKVYFVTDGGLFISNDAGETFSGANGRLHCLQFYADFSCSATDSLFAIGGLQDNATPVYEGGLAWRRVIGGDGLSTAIDPLNDNIVYGSYQYLNINKSTDKAQVFNFIANFPGGNSFCFAGPYVLCPSNTSVLYAGSDVVFKSLNGGNTWQNTNGGFALDGNPVLKLAVSAATTQIVYAATAPVNTGIFGIYKTVNGGNTWSDVTGNLPNRYIQDITVDPGNDSVVYLALGGFGTAHLYKSVNGAGAWLPAGTGLGDVPANTVAVDPLNTQVVYAGNDLGIFVSLDGGQTFQDFNDGLHDATMVFDISLSPSNRVLRLATHGKGVYERAMLPPSVTSVQLPGGSTAFVHVVANPFHDELILGADVLTNRDLVVSLYSIRGRLMLSRAYSVGAGRRFLSIDTRHLPAGTYVARCTMGQFARTFRVVKS